MFSSASSSPKVPKPFRHLLGYQVYLDRYSLKDLDRKLSVGQVVLADTSEDPRRAQLEVATVETVLPYGRAGLLMWEDGRRIELPLDKLMVPLEPDYSQLVLRVSRYLASAEKTPEARDYWEKEFAWALSDLRVVPGGRILAGAGSSAEVTLFNCLASETLVMTKHGPRPISELSGPVEVVSQGGVIRTAYFRSYGVQRLWRITLENGQVVHATAEHRWPALDAHGNHRWCTTRELAGKSLILEKVPRPRCTEEVMVGTRHGIVYGDGTLARNVRQDRQGVVFLLGPKESLADLFDGYPKSVYHRKGKPFIAVRLLPTAFKALPPEDASPFYGYGFFRGLMATDGHVSSRRGTPTIAQKQRDPLERLAVMLWRCGVATYGVTYHSRPDPFTDETDILRPDHLVNYRSWRRPTRPKAATVRVVCVEPTDRVEEVFCCEEPETHTFVIEGGLLTGNCFVIPFQHSPLHPDLGIDSRHGILHTLSVFAEILSRGGGVGINISALRPRGAVVYGVHGTSSGTVSWAELFSETVHLVQQGGCFAPDQRVATDKGLIPAKELAQRMRAGEVFHAMTHKGLRRITWAFENGIKPVWEVRTRRGLRLRVTPDHKMGVLRGGSIDLVPLRDLHAGDEILTLLGQGPSVQALLPLLTLSYERPKMSTTLKEYVRFPDALDEDLAYLLGYAWGNGHVYVRRKGSWAAPKALRLSVSADRLEIARRLADIIRTKFGIEPVVQPAHGSRSVNVTAYSRLLMEWLGTNGLLKGKAHEIRVPEPIFRSPGPVQAAFISGYFDADGSDRGCKGGYGIDSVSLAMLEDVQQILMANGIPSHVSEHPRSNGWRTIYRLTITGPRWRAEAARFLRCSLKLNRAAPLGTQERGLSYPPGLLPSMGVRRKAWAGIWDGRSRVSHRQMTMVYERLKAYGDVALAEQVEELLHVLPDVIVSITPVGEMDVYDFEVEDVHMLSGGGIYTSNSRRGAAMLILEDWHPDIEEFITAKTDFHRLTGFNVSVGISEALERAVREGLDWELVFPDYAKAKEAYDREWDGDLETWKAKGYPVKVYKTVKARELWDKIARSAWASGEPGIVRLGYINRMSNSWYFARIMGTNPCVTGDTLVATDRGLVPIALLVDRSFRVASDTRLAGSAGYLASSSAFCTGVKGVVRLRTREGFELRLTHDHKVRTPDAWVAAGSLRPGDKILVHAGAPAFGASGTLDEGRILGWFVGDGCFANDSAGVEARLYFYSDKREYAPLFERAVQPVVRPAVNRRTYTLTAVQVQARDMSVLASTRLAEWLMDRGLGPDDKLKVPDCVLTGSEEMQRGFLQGLFSADGALLDANGTKELRLSSVSPDLLRQVQLLLLNFGVFGRIYENRRSRSSAGPDGLLYNLLPDGRGSKKPYRVSRTHELCIGGASLVRFAAAVGLLPGPKDDRLRAMASSYTRGPYRQTFEATVESVEPDGIEPVFDLTVPGVHAFSANGLVVHNCAEEPLPSWGICDLGHLNLPRFLTPDGSLDRDKMRRAIRALVRLLDNVIDLTYYVHPAVKEQSHKERRIGMGTLGLGELLLRVGLRYGSHETLAFVDELYHFIAREAYLASVDLAQEKGAFPAFEADRFLASGFMQQMDEDIRDAVARYGIRNVTLLTQAPTGTTGTMVGTSTGIEPYYDWHYTRRGRFGQKAFWEPVYLELINPNPDPARPDPLPDHWVTAKQLAPEEHVRMMAAVQRWVDAAISKCVTADTWIPTERGLLPISSFYNEEAPDTFSGCTIRLASVGGVATASRFYFGGMRPVRRVIARGGWEIAGTDQHRVMVAGNRGLEWRRLWDLRPGDWLAIRIGTDVWPEEDADLSGFTPSPAHGPQKVIRWPSRMNPDLAWLLGAYVADGAMFHQNYTVKLFKNDPSVLQRWVRIVHDQFGVDGKIRRGRTCDEAVVASKTLVEFLTYCGMSTGASHKEVPWVVLRSSRASVLAFLSGVLLGGYVVPKTQRVGLTSKSRMLVRQVQLLLANLGIWSNIIVKKSPKYGSFYDLTICGDHARNLLSQIHLDEPHKAERANAILRMATRANPMDVLPFVRSQEVLSELPGSVRARYDSVAKRIRVMANRRMTRSLAVRVLDDPDVPAPDGVAFAVQNHLHFVPIVEVQDAGEQMVYDFEVPGAHAFVGNGIINHNTVNCPSDWTVEQVKAVYDLAISLGIKSIAIYRDRSRDTQVLESASSAQEPTAREIDGAQEVKVPRVTVAPGQLTIPEVSVRWDSARPRRRPSRVRGFTEKIPTSSGKLYVTLNFDEGGHPIEIILTGGRQGGEVKAWAELAGRWGSLALAYGVPMAKLAHGARGIKGYQSFWYRPDYVDRSVLLHSGPDAVGYVLETVPEASAQAASGQEVGPAQGEAPDATEPAHGDVPCCPECGESLTPQDGCWTCKVCGYARCD